MDDTLLDVNLWRVLAPTVTRRPPGVGSRRIAVDDSKRLYGAGRGLDLLESGVLAFLAAAGLRPDRAGTLVELLAPGTADRAALLPWYGALDGALPHAVLPDTLEVTAGALARRLGRAGIGEVNLSVEVLLASELNELLDRGHSKADAAMTRVALLARRLREVAGDRHILLHLDRQGGRIRYLEPLRTMFEGSWIWVLEESPRRSIYRIEDDRGTLELRVCVGGDRVQLPVALASMTAKLTRELMMAHLNRYWCGRVPDLRPTAGYPMDGYRFAEAVTPVLTADGVPRDRFIRRR